MKHNKVSIKWKIFLYLFGFTAILLVLLWIMQTVYLDSFYKKIKTNELNNALSNVEQAVESGDLEDVIDTISMNYDICILVTDSQINQLYTAEHSIGCTIHKIAKTELRRLYNMAIDNDGKVTVKNDAGINLDKNVYDEYPSFETPSIEMPSMNGKDYRFQNMPSKENVENLIIVKIFTLSDGTQEVVFLNSIITPVDATVHTLRIQLVLISVIMVILSLLISWLISWHISKPIISINNTAKKMAKHNLKVEFSTGHYKEVDELSDTLNFAASELAKAEDLQHELVANVSHDLRTPLTMITAYSEVMRDLPGENTPENVQVVIDEAKRLTNLVNDLLDISKLQAGVTNLELKEYDLVESIKNVIERYAKLVEQNGYKVTFNYNQDKVMVKADEFKIYQVIYNLINNAINYTGEDKSVLVKLIVNGSIARVEVIDTGEGIDKDELENVWERYYKIDKKHKRAVMGTGLGLSIVKSILKLHNAQYGVNSQKGKGTTFWFEMKIRK